MANTEKDRVRLFAELQDARQRVAELESRLGETPQLEDFSVEDERFHNLMDNVLFGVSVIDFTDGSILYANPVAREMTGYSASEVTQFKLWDLVDSSERSILFERLSAKASGHLAPTDSYVYTIQRKDGTHFKLETQGTLILYRGTPSLLVLLRDVSEREHLRGQVQQAQKLASIGTMAAGIAHDFNNIIYGIMLGAETVQRDLTPNDYAWAYLEQMRQSARRAAQLIRQLLSFSRRSQEEVEPLLLKPLIKESLSMLRATLPATVALDSRLCKSDLMIVAEPTLIQQVLVNLCTNASQAMQETGGQIRVSLESVELGPSEAGAWECLEPGGYAKLTVADNGPGMTPEVRDRVFTPFFTTKPAGEGTGLGLSVVRSIMDRLKGVIKVDSSPGKGTTFDILLPVAPLIAPRPFTSQPPPGPPRGDEHILVVDDEQVIRTVLREVLGSLGYQVTLARDGMEALELLNAGPEAFDLVISDQTMPGLTGSALMAQIHDLRPDLPVVLCTGHSDVLDFKRAKELGAADFLMKPLEGRELAEVVARCLRDKQ